jgi:hypothetical protein
VKGQKRNHFHAPSSASQSEQSHNVNSIQIGDRAHGASIPRADSIELKEMIVIASLTMTFALVLAIGLSLAIGVAAGYYSIVAILSALSVNRPQEAGVGTARLMVNTGTNG